MLSICYRFSRKLEHAAAGDIGNGHGEGNRSGDRVLREESAKSRQSFDSTIRIELPHTS